MKIKYKTINKIQLGRFNIRKIGDKHELSLKKCSNKIKITLPFVLNKDVATLAGMMPDGSLIKDIRRVFFGQKKDMAKHDLFEHLTNKLFSLNNKIFRKKHKCGTTESYINSTVLCHFLHYVLDFKKSDEELRIPRWIFGSPSSVKRAYLREAFAMEGTIFKSLTEIRFITKDYKYAVDIHKLMKSLGINSFVKERFGGYHKTLQYRISIYRRENFEKFKRIGFTVPMHVERFKLICKKYGI